MSTINLTATQLRQAADLQEQIEALKQQLAGLVGGTGPSPVEAAEPAKAAKRGRPRKLGISAEPATTTKPVKRTMSPGHKAKIRQAQAIRWAKYNAAKGKPALKAELKAEPAKKKGGMSAAGRARIIAAQKLRWAKVKAGKTAQAPAKTEGKKRTMSAAAKLAISKAAKARWAKVKAAKK